MSIKILRPTKSAGPRPGATEGKAMSTDEPHVEVYWSAPNEMWVVHRVRAGKVEAHEWVDSSEKLGDAVKRLLSMVTTFADLPVGARFRLTRRRRIGAGEEG